MVAGRVEHAFRLKDIDCHVPSRADLERLRAELTQKGYNLTVTYERDPRQPDPGAEFQQGYVTCDGERVEVDLCIGDLRTVFGKDQVEAHEARRGTQETLTS
jgi:hypothetical protein